jgi:hypothetical protein
LCRSADTAWAQRRQLAAIEERHRCTRIPLCDVRIRHRSSCSLFRRANGSHGSYSRLASSLSTQPRGRDGIQRHFTHHWSLLLLLLLFRTCAALNLRRSELSLLTCLLCGGGGGSGSFFAPFRGLCSCFLRGQSSGCGCETCLSRALESCLLRPASLLLSLPSFIFRLDSVAVTRCFLQC